ncbi:hypothetical protein TSUD_144500 [Trifolium subterraneum]|uniref:Uncharacterized protein n=1 Tax=Trifolium subterraneum TaxID=3900 RepID=A0A2Z6MZN4_TRISU|nr:hypothetical protein TSUD_144500 [Trifolium subterraneum]
MASVKVDFEVGNDGVAVITMCNPPVNALAIPIIRALKYKFDEAARRNDVKAIVLTGDITLVPDVSVELVVNSIEDSKKPVVAAVEGLALGGGLELAMGCHARVSAPKAQLGLPELTLGIIPGFGGTQRLPRLVGTSKAVEMMLTSKPITSEEGKKLGLIDAIVSPEELLKVSRLWALEIAERRKPWVRSLHITEKLGSDAREVLATARQHVKKTAPHLPQQQACIDVIEHGIIHGGYSGVLREAEVFKKLVLSETAKGLIHVFFAQRTISKIPGVTDIGLKPRNVRKAAVIGGGLMGSGIATALILGNIRVILKEVNSEYLQKGLKTIEANVRGLVTRKKLTQQKAEGALSLLKGVLDYTEFKDVDMVIEAVIEKISLKQEIFSDLEKICPPHCILATNTSTIDLNIIGEKISSQDRVVGAHFFSPAHIMPLLEIVRTNKTSAQVILDLITVGKVIKKSPVVVGNCTGFAVNRTFFPYAQGAHLLVNLGVDGFRIDRLITNFGLPMGPLQLQDLAGYGVALAVGKEFAGAFPDRTFKTPLVDLLIKSGRNGKNNGKGYYIYEKGSRPKPDPSPISITDQEIVEMILFPIVNEACRVLEEGVVIRASDLDIASVLGMSFPSYRGGIVFWADLVGAKHIYNSLKKWAQLYGNFYKPSRYLEERAIKGIPLSAPASSKPTTKARL